MNHPFARKILDALARFRDQTYERVLVANRLTESMVVKAAEPLRAIVEGASRQLEHLKSLRAFGTGDDESGFGRALARQAETVERFSGELRTLTEAQERQAERGVAELGRITAAGREIERLSRAARMLAINAQIEAVRLGEAGQAFGVVASEMKRLAVDVDKANALVAELVGGLMQVLPTIGAQAKSMAARSHEFSAEVSERMADVEAGVASLRRSIADTVDGAGGALDSVLQHSREALGQLQQQDPVAQSLLGIDRGAAELQTSVATALEVPDEPIRPPAIRTLSGDEPLKQQGHGQVILF